MRIAVAGAGVGGLAAAAFLADAGHDVRIFDQFAQAGPVGSGLVIQPVGQQVLAELGLRDAAMAQGAPIQRMLGLEATSGRRVLDVWYDRAEPPQQVGLGLHRAALFDLLHRAVVARGLSVEASRDIVRRDETALIFADGSRAGPFDLIVDAAGAGSPLSPLRARPLTFGAIWGTVDWPEDTALPRTQLSQRYLRADRMIGVMACGHLPGEAVQKATLFWSLPDGGYEAWRQAGLPAWREEALTLWPDLAPFLSQITDPAQMTLARYSHGTMRKPYGDRIVHIGDAAHRASPQLGQGANMALLDAQVLAACLSDGPLDRALALFARRRRVHVGLYQMMSAAFTPMYQSHSRVLPMLRDRVLFPVSQVPPVPRVLTRLVRGTLVRTGVL